MQKRMLFVSFLIVGCVLFAGYTYAHCGGCGPKKAETEKVTCPLSILAKVELTDAQEKQVASLKEAYLKAIKSTGAVACSVTKSKEQQKARVEFCTKASALLTDAQKATFQKLCPELNKRCGDGCAKACCAK